MVVVEDLISTGGSVLDAVAAAEREGADVIGVVAIFTYELPKADRNFDNAGVKLVTLSNYSELIKVAKVQGYINADGLNLLKSSVKIKKLGRKTRFKTSPRTISGNLSCKMV